MNGHNNYITANFIAFCIKYFTDLFILFLYILPLFQLLDVNIFASLKYNLTEKPNAVFDLI